MSLSTREGILSEGEGGHMCAHLNEVSIGAFSADDSLALDADAIASTDTSNSLLFPLVKEVSDEGVSSSGQISSRISSNIEPLPGDWVGMGIRELQNQNMLLKCLLRRMHTEVLRSPTNLPDFECLTDNLIEEYISALKIVFVSPKKDISGIKSKEVDTSSNRQTEGSTDIVHNNSNVLEFSHLHDNDHLLDHHSGVTTEKNPQTTNPFDEDEEKNGIHEKTSISKVSAPNGGVTNAERKSEPIADEVKKPNFVYFMKFPKFLVFVLTTDTLISISGLSTSSATRAHPTASTTRL